MVFALAGDSTITSLVPGFASVFLVVRFAAGFSAAVSPSSALAALVLVVVFFVVAFFAAGFFAAVFFAAVFFAGVSSGCAACWACKKSKGIAQNTSQMRRDLVYCTRLYTRDRLFRVSRFRAGAIR